ncbi:MAG: DUF4411 family protein [Candidatus Nanoarchaeia archaeon]
MSPVFIFDTCALIDYFKYYSNDNKELYSFLLEKIQSEEVVVIDKVEGELVGNDSFKKNIKSVDTNFLSQKVEETFFLEKLAHKNSKFNGVFDSEKKKFLDKYVDLYLIELVKHLEKTRLNVTPIIVTNETTNEKYNKNLFLKIPTICKAEQIKYINISQYLFKYNNFKIIKQ